MSALEALLRSGGTWALALACALWLDHATRRRGLDPPGFASPLRRGLAISLLTVVLWAVVFAGVGLLGEKQPPVDLAGLSTWSLFGTHAVLVAALAGWYALAFAGASGGQPAAAGSGPWAQLGLRTLTPAFDLGLGLVLGAAIWLLVIVVLLAAGALLWAFGGADALPKTPPALIPWLASQSVGLRLALCLSAGVVEEAFFRGFLQPRAGVGVSTACFVLAHLSYDQPFMLFGIALLSFLFAGIVRWRQTVVPAMVAHAFFDGFQLMVVIPLVFRYLPAGGLPGAG